jgi:hypothetical protein
MAPGLYYPFAFGSRHIAIQASEGWVLGLRSGNAEERINSATGHKKRNNKIESLCYISGPLLIFYLCCCVPTDASWNAFRLT